MRLRPTGAGLDMYSSITTYQKCSLSQALRVTLDIKVVYAHKHSSKWIMEGQLMT